MLYSKNALESDVFKFKFYCFEKKKYFTCSEKKLEEFFNE